MGVCGNDIVVDAKVAATNRVNEPTRFVAVEARRRSEVCRLAGQRSGPAVKIAREEANVRTDAARNRDAVLAAADALFPASALPGAVSMDDTAAFAGVGKGRLFRRFGDRIGLIRAVYDVRTADLREAATGHDPPLGDAAPPRERLLAVLDTVVAVKLDIRYLSLALEGASPIRPYASPAYHWLHELISTLLSAVGAPGDCRWRAHVPAAMKN